MLGWCWEVLEVKVCELAAVKPAWKEGKGLRELEE